MDDFKNTANNLAKDVKKLMSECKGMLEKVREKEPEKVNAILNDHKDLLLAMNKKDFSALQKLQEKYADNSN